MKRYKDIKGDAGSNILAQVAEQSKRLRSRMDKVRHKIAIMSGKGGVGKSIVTVNLAFAFASKGFEIGIADADINSPSIALMTGIHGKGLRIEDDHVLPAIGPLGIKIMSMDMLLTGDDMPVIWKGPKSNTFVWRGATEATTLREFLSDTEWGKLDYIFIDVPPGTDRFSNVAGLLPELNGVIIVTIPSEVSQLSVKKSIAFAKNELNAPVIGLIENMSGYVCQNCGDVGDLFHTSSVEQMALEAGIQYLGKIPFDKRISISSDKGIPFVVQYADTPAGHVFNDIMERTKRFLMGQ